jgi:uncharacterized membrane protein
MKENSVQDNATEILQSSRRLFIAGIVGFLCSLIWGLAPWDYLLSAIVVGLLLLCAVSLGWRQKKRWLCYMTLPIIIVGHKMALKLVPTEPMALFFQWLSLTYLVLFGTLMLGVSSINRLCKPDPKANI